MAEKEFIIHNENEANKNQIIQSSKNVIRNPEIELNDNIQTKKESNKNILISGSNYQNIVPNVGVRIQQEDKSKMGSLDFKNQFGRMSMKEYELLRRKYAQNNETNTHKNDYNFDYNNNNYNNINPNNERERYKRSETYNKNNHYFLNDINREIQDNDNNKLINNINSNNNIMHNLGLKHYDWGSNEKTSIPEILNHNINLRNINQFNINNDNNGNKVLNENLFKRNIKKKHSIYGPYYQDNNSNYKINKNKDIKEINYFNNQIMQNKNWGNENNSYKVGRTNFSNSIKRKEGINMRTRKKI